MLLRKLTITNIGLYQGRHEFDLCPKPNKGLSKNIILIGGMNGAGKTTLLDSLRLCLYGKETLGSKVSQKEYNEYLDQLIHRSKDKRLFLPDAGVEIDFDYTHLGVTDVYTINRSWHKNGSGVLEQLSIKKNQESLTDLVPEQWQAFLKDLIPPGLSGLFFFDGEKIQNLANDVQGSVELADSIRSLLGVDLAKRLINDLKVYLNKQATAKSDRKIDLQLQALDKDIRVIEKEEAFQEQERGSLESKKGLFLKNIDDIERKMKLEGADFATSRSNLIVEEKQLAELQEKLEDEIRQLCMDSLPFSLAPKLCKEFLTQLKKETGLVLQQSSAKELKSLSRKVNREVTPLIKAEGLNASSTKKVASLFRQWLIRHAESCSINDDHIIHGLSSKEKTEIEIVLNDASERIPRQIKQLQKSLTQVSDKRIIIQRSLASAPNDEMLGPLLKDLNKWNQKLGECNEKLKSVDEKIRVIGNNLKDLERQKEKLVSKKLSKGKTATKAAIAGRVIKAMNEYITKITERKIQQLNEAVLDKYSHLSRKTDAVRSVSIDPKTFKVTLLDANEHKLAMKELSAGEKQILAVSMLWALAVTSGRLLPVVIDTPLGRLDSSHRGNLISNYFPLASHQVIILSTDTEVDKSLYEKLSSYIANVYHLEYDESSKRTRSSRGYFWNTEAQA